MSDSQENNQDLILKLDAEHRRSPVMPVATQLTVTTISTITTSVITP